MAIATLVDTHMWLAAAVFVHQLAQLNTTLPIVVFNVTELPQPAVTLIESLGARVTSLEPSITVPEEFHSHLLQWPFSTKRGGRPCTTNALRARKGRSCSVHVPCSMCAACAPHAHAHTACTVQERR